MRLWGRWNKSADDTETWSACRRSWVQVFAIVKVVSAGGGWLAGQRVWWCRWCVGKWDGGVVFFETLFLESLLCIHIYLCIYPSLHLSTVYGVSIFRIIIFIIYLLLSLLLLFFLGGEDGSVRKWHVATIIKGVEWIWYRCGVRGCGGSI